MKYELVGQMITCTLIALIIGGMGLAQYKSNALFNIGFKKEGYNQQMISKIVGVHVIIFAIILFLYPIISTHMVGMMNPTLFGGIFASLTIIILLLSINISIHKLAKTND